MTDESKVGSRRGRFVRDDIVSARFRREHFEQVKAAAAGSKLTASRFVAAASLFAVRNGLSLRPDGTLREGDG